MKGCTVFADEKCKGLKKFHPLLICDDSFIESFIEKYQIKLSEIYLPPYNFKRTGCKDCPFSVDLQRQLEVMEQYFPAERKQCEDIWKSVYSEYRRIDYRIRVKENRRLCQ